jgi:hypothetical protein
MDVTAVLLPQDLGTVRLANELNVRQAHLLGERLQGRCK